MKSMTGCLQSHYSHYHCREGKTARLVPVHYSRQSTDCVSLKIPAQHHSHSHYCRVWDCMAIQQLRITGLYTAATSHAINRPGQATLRATATETSAEFKPCPRTQQDTAN